MDTSAPTILDYLETEFATFQEVPLNPLDAAVFAELAMVRAEGLLEDGDQLRHLLQAEHFPTMFDGFISQSLRRLLVAAAASPRFRTLEVRGFEGVVDEGLQTQFAGALFVCPGQFAFVAFRGTDGTITGWREDFNMAFLWPVPGQAQALAFLEQAAHTCAEPLYVGGHSKGGNLAAYAAIKAPAEVRERIRTVFNLDGPGFRAQAFTEEEYQALAGRIVKVIPKKSVVGLVLETRDDWRVVPSSNVSLMQHDAFSWGVDLAARDFAREDALSGSSLFFRSMINAWVEHYTAEELRLFVDTLFDALRSMATDDALDTLFSDGSNPFVVLADAVRSASGEGKALAARMAADLTATAAKTASRSTTELLQGAMGDLGANFLRK